MQVRLHALLPFLAALLFIARVAPAQETPPHVLVLDTLDALPIKLVSIAGDSLTYRGDDGKVQVISRSQVVGVLVAQTAETVAPAGPATLRQRIRLTDGQEFLGAISVASPEAQASDSPAAPADLLTFDSRALGAVRIPLDRARTLELVPGSDLALGDVSEDHLSLRNGDAVTGFIESIAATVTVSSFNDPATKTELPLSSIRSIQFANPPVPAEGAFIWTRQERFKFARVSLSASGEVTVHPSLPFASESEDPTKPLKLPITEVGGLVFDFRGLVPLSSLPPLSWTQSADRRWAPAPLTLHDTQGNIFPAIEFVGPGEAIWSLPAGTQRVAGRALLPETCRDWGDATFSISVDSAPAAAASRLTDQNPAMDFNVRIPPGAKTLRIKVEGGENGPIQDRVRLERTLLRIASPAASIR
jgi:hypothetical protein